jgi:hypothetical protein
MPKTAGILQEFAWIGSYCYVFTVRFSDGGFDLDYEVGSWEQFLDRSALSATKTLGLLLAAQFLAIGCAE